MTGNTMEWIDQPSGKHSCNAMIETITEPILFLTSNEVSLLEMENVLNQLVCISDGENQRDYPMEAKWFGVDVKQLSSLPIPKPVSQVREEARRKEYFFTRKLN